MSITAELNQVREATLTRMPQAIIKTFTDGIKEIRTTQVKEKALQKGDTIPDFPLTDINGNIIQLKSIHQSEFLVLNFYRGGWCPYCNIELREYEKLKNDFAAVNAGIVGISAEVPQRAAKTTQKNTISFPILTDVNAEFMKKIGIVYQLNEQTKKDFTSFGMDFTEIHGNENYELPVPAVYVINKNLEIVFIHFEADYMTRIEPNEVLKFLKTQTK